jgi:hypothetical protein
MIITVTWIDGTITTGKDWPDVERAIRAAQWVEYYSRRDFRLDMRHRCKVWSGIRPNLTNATSENFIRALESSGLCRVDTEDKMTNDPESE